MFNNIDAWTLPGCDVVHWVCWFDDDCTDQLGTRVAYTGNFITGIPEAVDGPSFYGDGND